MPLALADEHATLQFGRLLAKLCPPGAFTIHLEGDLGAGKTTLTRGMLAAFGYQGKVKSPTYTLVEPYVLTQRTVYHFDLYRLNDPQELTYLGLDDYFTHHALCIIEWPDKGEGLLPPPDLLITLAYADTGRQAVLQPFSSAAKKICNQLEQA